MKRFRLKSLILTIAMEATRYLLVTMAAKNRTVIGLTKAAIKTLVAQLKNWEVLRQ